MDCMTFRKLIGPYMNDELDSETLNDFLIHLESCNECKDELEINFIVTRGIEILDDDKGDYNLSNAFTKTTDSMNKFIRKRKNIMRLSFVFDTLLFWAVIFAAIVFLRIRFFG